MHVNMDIDLLTLWEFDVEVGSAKAGVGEGSRGVFFDKLAQLTGQN